MKETIRTELLVIGGGGAGLFAAIKARDAGVEDVTLVTKGKLGYDSIATFAAGVLDVVFPDDDKDEEFKRRTLDENWGAGLSDEDWLTLRLEEGYQRFMDLINWGIEFKRGNGGFLRYPMKRGAKKVMFHGYVLAEKMAEQVRARKVRVVEHTMVTDFLIAGPDGGKQVAGAIGFDVKTGETRVFEAKGVVVANGGCGYRGRFAAHWMDTGDGVAAALRAGAVLGRFDQLAFHTTAAHFDIQGLNMFQGLGGRWVNASGEEFMKDYDPELGNRAGMTRLSQACAMEVRAGKGPIFLDMTHFSSEQVRLLKWTLPTATRLLEKAGVIVGDRIVRKIEWAPVFYGTIVSGGGIETNTNCETSVSGLFAAGDARARARNFRSLVGAFVSGARAGSSAAEFVKKFGRTWVTPDPEQVKEASNSFQALLDRRDGIPPSHILARLQEILLPYEVSIIQHGERLERALKKLESLKKDLAFVYAADPHSMRLACEVKNMVAIAELQLRSLLLRTESRDACLREDFPYTDNREWLKWIKVKREGDSLKFWTENITYKRLRPEEKRYLHPVFQAAKKKGIWKEH
jgi:succinate dehydrogenase/fumarate reductase flavoprotein subunit